MCIADHGRGALRCYTRAAKFEEEVSVASTIGGRGAIVSAGRGRVRVFAGAGRTRRRVFVFLLGLWILAGAATALAAFQSDASKLDANLTSILNRYNTLWKSYPARELPRIDPDFENLRRRIAIDISGPEPVVPVAVTVNDQGRELAARRFEFESRIGNLITLRIPVPRLAFLAGLSSVVYVQASTIAPVPPGDEPFRGGDLVPLTPLPEEVPDLVRAAPGKSEVLLENDRTRVIQLRLKPGERTALYAQRAAILHALGAGSVRHTLQNGRVVETRFKAGQTVWEDAVVRTSQNVGRVEIRLLVIELKSDDAERRPVRPR